MQVQSLTEHSRGVRKGRRIDIRGAKVDGPSLRQGGSDLDTDPELLRITVEPLKGRGMELRAENLSDARRWITFLQTASRGVRPRLGTAAEAGTPSAPAPVATETVELPPPPTSEKVSAAPLQSESGSPPFPEEGTSILEKGSWQMMFDTASGKPYYWNRQTGQTTWTPPGGFGLEVDTSAVSPTLLLHGGWEEVKDSEGRKYYWNEVGKQAGKCPLDQDSGGTI